VPRTSSGLELRAVLSSESEPLANCGGGRREGDAPGVRDDDVVEGPVPLAEAGEADADYHGVGGMGLGIGGGLVFNRWSFYENKFLRQH
jgi:hypothetical protein